MQVELTREQLAPVLNTLSYMIDDLLRDMPEDDAFSAIHRLLCDVMEQFPPELELACRKGCSACCHQAVEIAPWEVVAIRRFLEALPPGKRRKKLTTLQKAARRSSLERVASGLQGEPCPFLENNGSCGIYEVRPLICRGVTSVSMDLCKQIYLQGAPPNIAQGASLPLMLRLMLLPLVSARLEQLRGRGAGQLREMVGALALATRHLQD